LRRIAPEKAYPSDMLGKKYRAAQFIKKEKKQKQCTLKITPAK